MQKPVVMETVFEGKKSAFIVRKRTANYMKNPRRISSGEPKIKISMKNLTHYARTLVVPVCPKSAFLTRAQANRMPTRAR